MTPKKTKIGAGVPLQMRTEAMVDAVGNKTLDAAEATPADEPGGDD